MAFKQLNNSDIEVGKPTKKSLFKTIKDNFDDHESRLSALSASANKIVMFDEFINLTDLGIGKIVAAEQDEASFQTLNGSGWKLCNGSSAAGTMWATFTGNANVPDYRGEFLRGLDNGRGVDSGRTLGSFQADQMEQHNHGGGDHSHPFQRVANSETDINDTSTIEWGGAYSTSTFTPPSSGNIIANNGGTHNNSENRPRNKAVNYFIKVDHDLTFNLKAREDQTIVAVKGYVIDSNGLPTTGTVEFDILKGSSRDALSSIFSVKPSLSFGSGVSDGDFTDSGTFLPSGADITQGDWIKLDVTSIMNGQTGLYIQVFSEPA